VDSFLDLLASALRMGTPLWLAAMGGLLSERSGVINLALEGFMLIGAFFAAAAAYSTGNPWLGLAAGAAAGGAIALLFAVLVLPLKGDQVVVGMGINLLALGVTPFMAKTLFDVTGSTPSLAMAQRFTYEPLFLAVALIGIIAFWYHRLLSGLWVQFAGEEPFALTAAGIKVNAVRWVTVLLSGALAGIGGAALSTMLASQFSRGMTAGNGFIAVAAIILGGWKPLPTAAICLLFGFIDALQMRLQAWFSTSSFAWIVPLVQLLPYIVTLIVLGGFLRGVRAPAALGSYEEE
jgi:simple sugar transport system permease protein